MKSENKEKITVQTTITADLTTVWEAWTNPEHITQWNFASETWSCPSAKNNLQPGGNFNWRMEAKDGSMGFDFMGVYEKIIEKELITYHMSDGRFVTISFSENGKGSNCK